MNKRILSSLVSALSDHTNNLVERPTFDGTNALQFMSSFDHYCSISNIKAKNRLQEMIKCSTKQSVARKIQRECVHTVDGVMVPFTWTQVREWFDRTYPSAEDADHLLLVAEQKFEDSDSSMLPDENMLTYLARFDDYVYGIEHARQLWNNSNSDVPDNKKYQPVSEKEKSTWLLARVNEYHFNTAGKFRPAVDAYEDIVAELKWKDNLRIRKKHKFNKLKKLGSPTETLNSSSISDTADTTDDKDTSKTDPLEKRISDLESALVKEKRKHNATREKAVKNKPFPANAASTDEPPPSGGSSSSSGSICYLCKSEGHYGSDCHNGVCSRCGKSHSLANCDMKVVDVYCNFCYGLGHKRKVCPYTYVGLLPFHKKKTREEAVAAYRKKMANRNKKPDSKSSGSSGNSPSTSSTQQKSNWKKVDFDHLRRIGGCINFALGKSCNQNPCKFSHNIDGSHSGGRPSRRRARSRSRSPARKRKRSKSRSRSSGRRRKSRQSRSRSRGRASGRRQLNHAGASRSRSGSPSRGRRQSRQNDRYHSSSRSRSRRGSPPHYSPVPPNIVDPEKEKYVSLSKEKYQELVASQIMHRQIVAASKNVPADSLAATDELVAQISDHSSRRGQ